MDLEWQRVVEYCDWRGDALAVRTVDVVVRVQWWRCDDDDDDAGVVKDRERLRCDAMVGCFWIFGPHDDANADWMVILLRLLGLVVVGEAHNDSMESQAGRQAVVLGMVSNVGQLVDGLFCTGI